MTLGVSLRSGNSRQASAVHKRVLFSDSHHLVLGLHWFIANRGQVNCGISQSLLRLQTLGKMWSVVQLEECTEAGLQLQVLMQLTKYTRQGLPMKATGTAQASPVKVLGTLQ